MISDCSTMHIFRSSFLGFIIILAVEGASRLQKHPQHERIIGGILARAGQFPYMADIYQYTADGTYFCAGALLNTQWVLTAGHCVANSNNFVVELGSPYLQGTDGNRVRVATDSYFLYPDFDPGTLENDIGLIRLRIPITLSSYIQPIGYTPSDFNDTLPAITLGWGQTSDQSPDLSNNLMYVEVAGISNLECSIVFGDQIKDGMICVNGNFNEGFCEGDSGAPLVQKFGSINQVVVGVASFISFNGCESTDPSGYTRVSFYEDWITDTIESESSKIH